MKTYMEDIWGIRAKSTAVFCIGLFGFISCLYAIYARIADDLNLNIIINCIVVLVFLIIIFPQSVTLPSGSVWRPSIGLIMYSSFVLPLPDALLVTFLGIMIASFKERNNIKNIFVSFGHLALGIFSIKMISNPFSLTIGYVLPQAFFWMVLGLVTHFFVNRFISAFLVSYRKGQAFFGQIKLIKKDLNWGYVSTYLTTLCMVLLYHAYGSWGIFGIVLLLYSIYFSVSYFKKANYLEMVSLTDALTGAENRAAWEKFKGILPQKGTSGTLALIDLDNFKAINDQWGHDVGDKILCETANCLKMVTPKEQRVFRFGGDEFILYIPHHKEEQPIIQQLIHKKIKDKNNEWMSRKFSVSMSMGFVFISSNKENLDEIFIQIDQQMYKNKAMQKRQMNN